MFSSKTKYECHRGIEQGGNGPKKIPNHQERVMRPHGILTRIAHKRRGFVLERTRSTPAWDLRL